MDVYLDNNATTAVDERVVAAMLPWLAENFGNPSAVYGAGRLARAALDQAREQVAALVGAHPSQVIFTSGGTEANNLAIKGAVVGLGLKKVAWSAVEHPSIRDLAPPLRRRGCEISELAVDPCGRVEPATVSAAVAEGAGLVSVMWANNETGVIQDIPALAAAAREGGALFHTDAVQAAGKIEVDFGASGAHLMSLSSHKLYGPKGAGALIVDKRLDLEPLLHGGGQERGWRSGTENVPALVGFGMAAHLAREELAQRQKGLLALRCHLEQRLTQLEGVRIFAAEAERLPNTVYLGVAGMDGEALLMSLDGHGFAVASGSACKSRSTEPSKVLMAMGVEEKWARGAIRVSLGVKNTREEVDSFVDTLAQIIQSVGRMAVMANT